MASKGEAILKLLQGPDLKELNDSLKAYLAPLLGFAASGKDQNVEKQQHTLAKEYVPFLVQLLKICGAKLASVPSRNDIVVVSMADELFSAMIVAIDGLSHLRSQLTGSFFEMELQRYGLVRRLMVWKRYSAALSQCQVLFRSLCQLTSTPDSKGSAIKRATSGRNSKTGAVSKKSSSGRLPPLSDSVLRLPREGDVGSGLPALVVAAVIDLIWCIAESSEHSPSCFQMASQLPEQLTPWISVLDPGTASKQREALFRAVYKLTLIIVADPTNFDPSLVQQFCSLTLTHCASSTQCDQYAKVARKLFSTLSSHGLDSCSQAVEICASAFSEVLSHNELRGVWNSYDFAELVEWFTRSCQISSKIEHGWLQIHKLVDHIQQVFPCAPVVITGIYAVGLVLMQAETEKLIPEMRIKESRADGRELADLKEFQSLSRDTDFFRKAGVLLRGAEKVLKLWLQLGSAPSMQKQVENGSVTLGGHIGPGCSDVWIGEVNGRTYVIAARALHYVQKSFTRFVQNLWNACSATSSVEELPYRLFNSALQKVLQLFYPVVEKGMRCSDLSDNEKDIFRKGFQMALQATLAGLRLSLLLHDSVQENFDLMSEIIDRLQPEEKWWFMASTYNMGVQLFNIKQYTLACWPLELANKAVWAKVKSSSFDDRSNLSVNEILSEACAKCLALVDARIRNGEPGKARVILIDGLVQWAQAAQGRMHPIQFPQSLVKSFVKLMCIENKSVVHDTAQQGMCSLYSFICDIEPPLPAGIVGLLLEEEHVVCQTMEEQFPDACRIMQEQILQYLLIKLYTGQDFVLERSRVLMRKCRDLRRHGPENLSSCIDYISEAVSTLEAALEDKGKTTPRKVAGLEKQLAVAYCIKGICSYEMDPCSQEFLPNVVLSLNMWRCVRDSDGIHGGLCEIDVSSTTAINEEESLMLLLYISDLLSIQGFSVLLREALDVILKLIRNSKQSLAATEWIEFWMRDRVGHLLCAVPFSTDFLSTIRQTFNAAANPEEFWQGYVNLFPGSLLEAHRHSAEHFVDLIPETARSSTSTGQNVEAIELIKNILHARLSEGQRSSQFTLRTAGLHHLISELSLSNGDTDKAIRSAKEAFQLRSRLFKYVFCTSGNSASVPRSSSTSNTPGSGDPNVLQVREHLGPLAIWSWPSSVKIQHCLSHPSQWRILGDYIESLMQVGIIYERMGAVDEAERSFREGHRLSLAQNLPWALACFSLCLGEVHRKKQLWDSAERYFMQARQVLDELQTSKSCESCILTGKALLEMRTGDLHRHYWCYQRDRRKERGFQPTITDRDPAKSLTSALCHYEVAFTGLYQLMEDIVGTDFMKEKGWSKSLETERSVLRSLQRKGKSVSLEIVSGKLEETRISGPETGKSKLRKSVQSRREVLSISKKVSTDMERDLSALCNGMRLTSLASDSEDSSQVAVTKSKSETRNGLRSRRRNAEVSLQEARRQEQVEGSEVLEEQVLTKQGDLVQKDWELMGAKAKGNISCMARAGENLSHGTLGRLSFSEDWPACKWSKLGRKLMSRVLLQRGKCHIHLGELDEAAEIFERSMSILNISSRPETGMEGRSPFPVEEGAILYHFSRLCLQRGQQGDGSSHADGSTRKSSYLDKGEAQSIRWLYSAFSLCRQVPQLLQKIAKLLAILHVPRSMEVPFSVSPGIVSPDEMAEVAAFFHQASVGTTVRQQHLAVLDSKLDDEAFEDNQHFKNSLSKARLEKMERALRIDPVNVGSVGLQAREFLDRLPSSLVCCISFVSAEDVNLLKVNGLHSVEDSDPVTDWLLVTRLSVASKPVVVLLPVLPLFESLPDAAVGSKSLEYTSTPYDLSDAGDDDCNPSDKHETPPPEILNQTYKNNHSVLRRVAAEFASVLEESRLSTSGSQPVTTLEEKSIWWKWRMELDRRLSLLLRMVEDLWLGPFKCLLIGEPQKASTAKTFELCTGYLSEMMSSMMPRENSNSIDHNFMKILLQAVGCLTSSELEKAIAEILGFLDYCSCDTHENECGADCKACRWKMSEAGKYEQIKKVADSFRAAYFVSTQVCDGDSMKCLIDENNGKRRSRRQAKGKAGPNNQNPLDVMLQMVSDGSYSSNSHLKRQPVQLILDSDSQALPWESLPFLRDHEIYRIPSLGTMHAVYVQHQCDSVAAMTRATDISQVKDRKVEGKKVKAVKSSSIHAAMEVDSEKPLDVTYVNPYNTYYILNPNGDLPSTQEAFEEWFTKQPGWKGKAGTIPTAEEYQMGLRNHDLFVYLGHGSGDQFLPERYVRQLNHCAASLLMGCSSGRLSFRGDYQPVGVVLSYLMAGCPAIIANLWDVTDGDIDRFSRCLLHSWLASQSETLNSDSEKGQRDMSDCELAMRERQNVNACFQGRFPSKVLSSTLSESQILQHGTGEDVDRMGSAVGDSRKACRLPHLIGASPVCYGVPTGLWKQICQNDN